MNPRDSTVKLHSYLHYHTITAYIEKCWTLSGNQSKMASLTQQEIVCIRRFCDWKYSGVTQGTDQLQRAGCRTRDDHLLAVSSPDSYLRSSHYSITQTFYEWAGWLKNIESVCIRSHALLLVNVLKTVLFFLIRWTRLTDIFCFSLGIDRITCPKK